VELEEPFAAGVKASLRADLPAQAGGRIHGQGLGGSPTACAAEEAEVEASIAGTDASLISDAAYLDSESSARLITPPDPVLPEQPPFKPQSELVALPRRVQAGESAPAPDEPPRYASRNWRAEAWTGSGSGRCAPSSGVRVSSPGAAPVLRTCLRNGGAAPARKQRTASPEKRQAVCGQPPLLTHAVPPHPTQSLGTNSLFLMS